MGSSIVFINGSPHPKGCTWRSMVEVSKVLHEEGFTIEWIHVGNRPVRGCMGCNACKDSGLSRCIYGDDVVNVAISRMEQADGLVIGSPVHFGAASGAVISFLDRMFYAANAEKTFYGKPGASIVCCRRGGATSALEQLNKYFMINNMPMVPSYYWNMAHGNTIREVEHDSEGMFIMRQVGRNLAWMIKSLKAAKEQGITFPYADDVVRMNFIREHPKDLFEGFTE